MFFRKKTGHVILITFQYSVVMKGIENKLQDLGYQVDLVSEYHRTTLPDFINEKAFFRVYLPGDILDNTKERKLFSEISEMVMKGGYSSFAGRKAAS